MAKVKRVSNIILGISVLLAVLFSTTNTIPVDAASIPSTLNFNIIASGLTNPDFITNAGDGSNRLFILQQTGQILIFKNGSLLTTPFLNISGLVSNFTGMNGEQGLLCLAFDPNYVNNGFFYITYTTTNNDPTFPYTTTLARYHVSSGNSDVANPNSGTVLLSIPKKYTNHNGGMISFGPDGYLYMSMGDGGSGGDPDNNAQNLHTMLGKLLRIDVNSTPPAGKKYVIPSTNPFYTSSDTSLKKEIWAYGLRNPWRFSFDRLTGDLYIGDVGQDREEEVDFQSSSSAGGQNYGWRILEGNLCYNPSKNCTKPSRYVPPVATYDHGTNDSFGCSITGGYVYRGSQFPALQGVYFYGDYCSGKVLGLVKNSNNTWTASLIVSTNYSISSFGQDEQGELYLADYAQGKIYQLTYASFADVPPSHPFFRYIQAFYNAGLTVGCSQNPLKFCPDSLVTRAEMAVFIERAKGNFNPQPNPSGMFADMPYLTFTPFIEQLYNDGITTGCSQNPLMYCPTSNVTRGEMAVFIERAIGHFNPQPNPSGMFADLPYLTFTPFIEQLYNDGITAGCQLNPLKYCPANNVTRAEMAVFIVRAFKIPY